jgi:hypothetical protein
MDQELKTRLKEYQLNAKDIEEKMDKLRDEYIHLQVEATKEIINTFIKDKKFNEVCLTFTYEQMTKPIDEDIPIYMEITCLADHLRYQISKEFEKLIRECLPGNDYHFQIKINDYVTFVGNDFDYGFVFERFDVERIKSFAKEYGFTIKALGDESYLKNCEKNIEEEMIRRNNMLELKEMFDE